MSLMVCKFKGEHGGGRCRYADKTCNIRICEAVELPLDELTSCPKGYDKPTAPERSAA